ncbi:MAG: M23 family metallopeptidase [Terracoccus sp.]
MQEAKQSERDLVVLNIRLRARAAPLGALLLLFALLPFLAGSASPAVSQQNVVLAAGTPEAVGSAAAIVAAHDQTAEPQDRVVSDAAARGGGQIVFPELALPGAPGSLGTPGAFAPEGVVVLGSAGPEFGSTLLAGSLAGSAGFIRPVDAPETSGFGPRIHPLLGRAMFHTGIDLGAACRTPIKAAADGTVVYASTTPSWGNRIIIAHSATLKTAYGHQSQMFAKVGDVVKQGQVIGLVGTTGWSTGCHLHFDVIVNNHYVDPAPYLGFGGTHAAEIPFYAPAPGHSSTSPTTPVVKHPTPPVIDGDVPIPPAPASTTTTRPTPTTPVTTTKPPVTTTTPPATTTTRPPSTTTTTTRPPSTTPPTTTTTTTPTTTTPPSTTTTTTTTTPPTTTSSAASGTTTTTQCAPTASDTVTPPAGSDVPTTLPSCSDPASIAAATAAKSVASTTQAVLKMTSGVVTP